MSTTTFFEQTIAVLASSSGTNGALGAMEVRGPRGSVPPLHVHHREDEAFYVVEGDYSVVVGAEVIGAAPGTWVWGPDRKSTRLNSSHQCATRHPPSSSQ